MENNVILILIGCIITAFFALVLFLIQRWIKRSDIRGDKLVQTVEEIQRGFADLERSLVEYSADHKFLHQQINYMGKQVEAAFSKVDKIEEYLYKK